MSSPSDEKQRPIAYRPSEAARMLGVSLSHLQRMTRSGEVPYANLGGLKVYSDDVLREWIKERTSLGKGSEPRSRLLDIE